MRLSIVSFVLISYLLTACGAQPASPVGTPPNPGGNTETNSPSTQAAAATDTEANHSTAIPASTATSAATFTPTTIPAPTVIGLDNFNQLVTLHDYAQDIEAVIKVQAPDYAAFAPVYSPDRQYLAGAIALPDDKRGLLVLKVATGDLVASILVDDGVKKIFSWSFSPDSQKLLYSTYPDGKINIWDIAEQKLDHVLWSKKGYVISDVATRPDGKQITAVVGDSQSSIGRLLTVWDAASGELVKQIPADTQYGVDISEFSSDGSRLVLSTQKGGNELTVIDTSSWNKISSIHPAAILETICSKNAFPCLPATVIYTTTYSGDSRDSPGYFGLQVRFTKQDGSIYADDQGATLFELYLNPDPGGKLKVNGVV